MIGIIFRLIVEWFNRDKAHGLEFMDDGILKYSAVRWFIYYAIIIATILFMCINQSFIYFQF